MHTWPLILSWIDWSIIFVDLDLASQTGEAEVQGKTCILRRFLRTAPAYIGLVVSYAANASRSETSTHHLNAPECLHTLEAAGAVSRGRSSVTKDDHDVFAVKSAVLSAMDRLTHLPRDSSTKRSE